MTAKTEKLYKAEVTYNFDLYFVTDETDQKLIDSVAIDSAQTELEDVTYQPQVRIQQVTSMSDVEPSQKKYIPYGRNYHELTCEEFLKGWEEDHPATDPRQEELPLEIP